LNEENEVGEEVKADGGFAEIDDRLEKLLSKHNELKIQYNGRKSL
jgi:hypothetical protein